jgi:O-antigen/teichoic acid export membrane protein
MYNLFTLYSFLIIAFILFFGEDIILMLYGEVYSDSILILKIIVFSNLFSFLGAASSRWYMNCGFEKKILYRNLFGVFFNILGNFIFIPIYGAVGAAATTIISQVSANLIFDSLDKSTRVVFNQKVNSLLILFNLKYFLGKKDG